LLHILYCNFLVYTPLNLIFTTLLFSNPLSPTGLGPVIITAGDPPTDAVPAEGEILITTVVDISYRVASLLFS